MLTSVFASVGKPSEFPKMFNTRKYPEAILRFGNVRHMNAACREGVIKPVRTCYAQTSKHTATVGVEVAKQVQLHEALGAAARQQAVAHPPNQHVGTGVVSGSL